MLRFLFLLALPISLFSTELAPWFGKDKIPEFRTCQSYQHISKLQQETTTIPYVSNDFLSNYSLCISPSPEFSLETELSTADTGQRSFGINDVRLTGRYLFSNDIKGDNASVAIGATAIRTHKLAVNDLSTFHYGRWEFEAHLAMGKEWPCECFWDKRVWGLIAAGTAHSGGKYWLRGKLCFEQNNFDEYRYGLFVSTLWGLGNRALVLPHTGYGHIKHRSVDIGVNGAYTLCVGELSAEYTFRTWAKNFPAEVTHRLSFCLKIPFRAF